MTNREVSSVEMLTWLAEKADKGEAMIAFGAGGWRQHVAPAIQDVLKQLSDAKAELERLYNLYPYEERESK